MRRSFFILYGLTRDLLLSYNINEKVVLQVIGRYNTGAYRRFCSCAYGDIAFYRNNIIINFRGVLWRRRLVNF